MSALSNRLGDLAAYYKEYVKQLSETPHADPQSVAKYKQVADDLNAAVKLVEADAA